MRKQTNAVAGDNDNDNNDNNNKNNTQNNIIYKLKFRRLKLWNTLKKNILKLTF